MRLWPAARGLAAALAAVAAFAIYLAVQAPLLEPLTPTNAPTLAPAKGHDASLHTRSQAVQPADAPLPNSDPSKKIAPPAHLPVESSTVPKPQRKARPCPENHVCRNGRAYRLPKEVTVRQHHAANPSSNSQSDDQVFADRCQLHAEEVPCYNNLLDAFRTAPATADLANPGSSRFQRLSRVSQTTLLVTMLSEPYLRGHEVFMQSLLDFNPWLQSRLVVIDLGLTAAARQRARQLYARTEFVQPRANRYNLTAIAELRSRHASLRSCYYKLDVFGMREPDVERIISVDTGDMLVLGDLSPLFLLDVDFAAVPAAISEKYSLHFGHPYFNAGLVVIGQRVLGTETYEALLSLSHTLQGAPHLDNHNDQDVLNAFFRSPVLLDKGFNAEKRLWDAAHRNNAIPFSQVRILHFVGGKPWELAHRRSTDRGYTRLEALWWDVAARDSVVVLGNAPSVLESEAGFAIDRFATVVRLTNFQINGFEAHVGSRTDEVFVTFATKAANFSVVPSKHVHLFGAEHRTDLEWLRRRVMQPGSLGMDPATLDILPEFFFSGLNEELGLVGKQRCSTGVIALKWALHHEPPFRQVYSHGITFFSDMGAKLLHYTDHTSKRDDFHDFAREREHFAPLFRSHVVRELVASAR